MDMHPRGNKPVFADPRSDLPFKKAFGTIERKGNLIALLNALLRLPEAARIVDLEYLSPDQLPPHDGLKLSILDVKCTDALGTRYVVEMQVFPVEGFEKRVVYNACKAYAEQLGEGDDYSQLSDVVSVTICNFELWPAPVGLWSRWRMREETTGAAGLNQVQHVFLELPKYPGDAAPGSELERWAWFFREARNLREIPAELRGSPLAAALEAVRRVNFNDAEWTEYEREKMAEQDYRGGLSLARKEGLAEGHAEGLAEGLRIAILDLCEVLAITPPPDARQRLDRLDRDDLEDLRARIKATRRWDPS